MLLTCTLSSECTDYLRTLDFPGASGRGQLTGKFRVLDFSFEGRFEFALAELHNELEAELAFFEVDLFEGH